MFVYMRNDNYDKNEKIYEILQIVCDTDSGRNDGLLR